MSKIIQVETGKKAFAAFFPLGNGSTTLPTDVAVEIEAMATAGIVLNEHLPDRFCAGKPRFDATKAIWRVPVLLSYPHLGVIGQAGEIVLSDDAGQVLSFTPIEQMKAVAETLIEQHREQIEAPFFLAGNP